MALSCKVVGSQIMTFVSYQEWNTSTLQLSTWPVTGANAMRLQETTNRLLKESISAIPLKEEAPNAYPN